jgi:hypothetical protein
VKPSLLELELVLWMSYLEYRHILVQVPVLVLVGGGGGEAVIIRIGTSTADVVFKSIDKY